MFLNITYQKIIQEYSLDHCFILQWAAQLLSCTEYCIADLVSLVSQKDITQVLYCTCENLLQEFTNLACLL